MIISLHANKLGLSIRGSEILQKWLWLESQVIDYDSSRFESFCEKRDSSRVEIWSFSTWLDSSRVTKIVTWVESLTRVTLSLLICNWLEKPRSCLNACWY